MMRMTKYAAVLGVAMLVGGSAMQAQPATLTIQADKPVAKVSPTLYGLMTEEINYSYDGGLYGELVQDRTFQSSRSDTENWVPVPQGTAHGLVVRDPATGPSAALPASLKVTVTAADKANAFGLRNRGWWGVPLRANTTYTASVYAKGDAAAGVRVSLVANNTGKVLASASLPALTGDWKQYSFTLKTGADVPASADNQILVSVEHPGTVWLQLLSVFPPTYKGRVNGNRVDLMELMAAMHPTFLRFPGGNYLEGDHINERFDWKKTIGPLVDRAGHRSPWKYQSSDGMGLLEFLGWCEDLKMQPVLAVYGGYSLAQDHVKPGSALEPYVQDALDELEYVTGSVDTRWGGLRAKGGHPEPFKLTYVEIGNEDQFDKSGSYDGRYAQFYKAIKAKYPELQLIATTPVKGIRPDLVDDHYYLRATEFFEDAKHYDKTDRNCPKIFVGEWATREGAPTPNFGAALGDAAWMTGLERNSDLVVMAAYAPLLVNVNPGGMQWETDLIGYDAVRSYGSPSYYAQVIFSKSLGDQTVASKLDGAGPKFFYSITRDSAKKRLYLKLVNASSIPQPVEIEFPGAKLAPIGKLVSLSAHSTQATNSLSKPEEIVPVESVLNGVSSHLKHTLPGYAIQVIQVDER